MTSKYGRGIYGKGLFGATLDTITVTITDNVTKEIAVASSNLVIAQVQVTNPGPQNSVVNTQI